MGNASSKFGKKLKDTIEILTPSGNALGGDVANVVKELITDKNVQLFGAMFGSMITGNKMNAKDFKGLISDIADKNLLSKINDNNKNTLKNIVQINETTQLISKKFSDYVDFQTEFLTKMSSAEADKKLSIFISLDTTKSQDFDKILNAVAQVSDENVKNIAKLYEETNRLSFINMEDLKPKFIDPMNALLEIKVENVSKIVTELVNSEIFNKLQIIFSQLKTIEFTNDTIDNAFLSVNQYVSSLLKIGAIDSSQLENIPNTLDLLLQIFSSEEKTNINALISSLNNIETLEDKSLETINKLSSSSEKILMITQSLNDENAEKIKVALQNLKDIIKILKSEELEFANEDLDNIISSMSNLEKSGDKIKQSSETYATSLEGVTENVEKSKKSLDSILGSYKDMQEKADEIGEMAEETSKANIVVSIGDLGKAVIAISAVLLIGSFVVKKHPTIIKDAITFGKALLVFSVMTLTPLVILGGVASLLTSSDKTIDALANVVIKLSAILIIGTLFYRILGLKASLYAKKFTTDLNNFILGIAIILPIIAIATMFGRHIEEFTDMIIKLSVTMMIGALFMAIGGGKLAKSALLFGAVLMGFIFMVMLPVKLLTRGGIFKNSMAAMDDVSKFVATSAAVMMIGALFMLIQNGKLALKALLFGVLLSAFIFVILLPIKWIMKGGGLLSNIGKGKILEEFTNFMIVSSLILMIGGLFMMIGNGKAAKGALQFALLLTGFIFLTSLAIKLLIKNIHFKDFKVIRAFKNMVENIAIILIVGGLLMSDPAFAKNAIKFAVLTTVFIALVAGIFILVAKVIGRRQAKAMLLFSISMTIAVGTVLLAAWLANTISIKQILKAGLMLLMTAIIFAGFALIIGNRLVAKLMRRASINIILMSIAFLILGVAISMMIKIVKSVTLKDLLIMGAIVIGLVAIFAIVGIPMVALLVGLGSLVFLMMSVALLVLGVSFLLIHFIVSRMDLEKDISLLLVALRSLVDGLCEMMSWEALFKILGAAVVAILITIIAVSLSVAFTILHFTVGQFDILPDIEKLKECIFGFVSIFDDFTDFNLSSFDTNDLVGSLGAIMTSKGMGLWINLIAGLVATILITIIAGALSAAFIAIRLAMAGNPQKQIKNLGECLESLADAIGVLDDNFAITAIGSFFGRKREGGERRIDLLAASAKAVELGVLLLALAVPLGLIATVSLIITKNNLDPGCIGSFILDFVNKIQPVFDPKKHDWDEMEDQISDFKRVMFGITRVAGRLADVVFDVASMRIPVEWNKDGKAIDYRYLKEKDFKEVGKNIMHMFEALFNPFDPNNSESIYNKYSELIEGVSKTTGIRGWWRRLWKGNESEGPSMKDKFNATISISYKISRLVGSLANNISKTAKLMMPVEWNDNGDAIDFRPMKEDDFTRASEGIVKVLSTMIGAIASFCNDPTLSPLIEEFAEHDTGFMSWFRSSSKIGAAISMSFQISNLVGSIANTIASLAELKVATEWDDRGNPTNYITLADEQFSNVTTNIQRIMTAMVDAVIEAFGDGKNNAYGSRGKLDQIRWIMTANEGTVSILSEVMALIGDMATTIVNVSNLTIDEYDDTGKIIGKRTLDTTDIQKASTNIGIILTTIPQAIYDVITKNYWFFLSDDLVDSIEKALVPSIEVLKGVVDIISAYANLRIPTKWNDQGIPTEYERFNPSEEVENMKKVFSTILCGIFEAITKVYYGEDGTGGQGSLKYFMDNTDTNIKTIVDRITSVISSMKTVIEVIQAYADFKVAKYNDKGEIIGYETFLTGGETLDQMLNKVGDNLQKMITGICKAVLLSGEYIEKITAEGTPYQKAMKSVSEMASDIGKVITTISSILNLKIPVGGFDKDGKPKGYVSFDNYNITRLQETLSLMICAVPSAILVAYYGFIQKNLRKLYGRQDEEGNLKAKKGSVIYSIKKVLESSGEIVAQLFEMTKNFSDMKIPTKYDKDGNAIAFTAITEMNYDKLAKTISELLLAVPTTLTSAYVQMKELSGVQNDEAMVDFITNMGRTMTSATKRIVKQIPEVIDEFINIKDSLKNINPKEIRTKVGGFLSSVSLMYVDILKTMSSSESKKAMDELGNSFEFVNIAPMAEEFLSYTLSLVSISNAFELLQRSFRLTDQKAKDFSAIEKTIINAVGSVVKISQALETPNSLLSEDNGSWFDRFTTSPITGKSMNQVFKEFSETSLFFSKAMDNLSNAFNKIDSLKNASFENIDTLLNVIYTHSDMITDEQVEKISKESNAMEKYTKSIDQVNIYKVNRLIKLFEAMESWSNSIGDLNNFTKAISNELATSLIRLTDEIEEAKTVIKTADEQRISRQKQLDKSIEKISKIMQQTLHVNVSSGNNNTITSAYENPKD